MKERKEDNPGTWTVGIWTACGLEAYCPDRVEEEEVFPFLLLPAVQGSSDVRCGGGSCLIRLFEAGVPAVLY